MNSGRHGDCATRLCHYFTAIILRLHNLKTKRNRFSRLTAFDFFVGKIKTITMAIAEFRAFNTFRSASGRSLRAQELVIRASDECAVGFVGIISAIGETIATPPVRKAKSVVTPELTAVTRREICTNTTFFIARAKYFNIKNHDCTMEGKPQAD